MYDVPARGSRPLIRIVKGLTMRYPNIEHHGAADGESGPWQQLHMDAGHTLLVDCGLFQGAETSAGGRAGAQRWEIEFPLTSVKALVAPDMHIDHVRCMSWLVIAGFHGPIYCSEPSAKLLPITLEDAFKLGFSREQREVEWCLKRIEQSLRPLPYNQWHSLVETEALVACIRLQRAGHTLGSAYVEVDVSYPATGEHKRIVFSGDLGAANAPLLMPPAAPEQADILVLESTYGDRLHEDRLNRRQRLQTVIEQALADKDTVLIPAFSVDRTQESLCEQEETIHNPVWVSAGAAADARTQLSQTSWPELSIILDSPLAHGFSRTYRVSQPYWSQEARTSMEVGCDPLALDNLITIDSHAGHIVVLDHLAQIARPPIVMASSGVCSGGHLVDTGDTWGGAG